MHLLTVFKNRKLVLLSSDLCFFEHCRVSNILIVLILSLYPRIQFSLFRIRCNKAMVKPFIYRLRFCKSLYSANSKYIHRYTNRIKPTKRFKKNRSIQVKN